MGCHLAYLSMDKGRSGEGPEVKGGGREGADDLGLADHSLGHRHSGVVDDVVSIAADNGCNHGSSDNCVAIAAIRAMTWHRQIARLL